MERIWDLMPDGGGPPVQVVIGNPNEAIAAHPERYTRVAPDGTVHAQIAKRNAEKAEARAAIEKEKNDKLAEIAKERQARLDAIAKEESDARTDALELRRAKAAEEAKKDGEVISREGEKQAVEAEAKAAADLAQHEADQKKKELEAGPPPASPPPPPPPQPEPVARTQKAEH